MSYIEDVLKISNINVPWDILRGSNILITGATGLIGSCLVEALLLRPNRDYNVYALGRNEQRMASLFNKYAGSDNFHTLIGDVTKDLSYEIPFHFIIHAASGAAPSDFSHCPVEVMKANITGVANLIEYGMKHDMQRFLYISSGEVYGEGDGRIFTEDYSGYVDCTSPRSCYPSSKRAAETLCASYAAEYGLDFVIARPCHTYGPNFTESDNRVYAQFIRNILNGEDIVMKSNGAQFRSWCYVVDCVSALLFILLKGDKGHAYNIADESSNITIKDLADMVANIGKRKVVVEIPSENEKAGYNIVKKSLFSTKKLEMLGWSVNGNMRQKLESTIMSRYDNYSNT